MLTTVFLSCAVVGGALVLAQLLMSVLAFGLGHGVHMHHHAGPAPGFRGGLRGAHRFRLHFPRSARSGAKPAATHQAAAAAGGVVRGNPLFAWVLSMFNLQGIVAGATVFGLTGLAARAGKLTPDESIAIAIAAALLMMAAIERLFEFLTGMDIDHTVEVQQAVGLPATVYLGIPANNQGQGKVTMSLQERLMEFSAVTFGDAPLATGDKVIVVNVLDPSVMVVVPEAK